MSWQNGDINTNECTKSEVVTSSYGLQQLISQPTHLLANTSSCIDLIFTDQLSLVIDCGIHPRLHSNVIIKLFIVSKILKLFILHPIRDKSGISKDPILI